LRKDATVLARSASQLGLLRKLVRPFVNVWEFLQDVRHELERVVWPNHEDTWTFTVIVLITILIVGIWVGALDWIFARIMGALMNF